MASVTEHSFHGVWEIVKCYIMGCHDRPGMEGVKFRLDDMGDITWYRDIVSPNRTFSSDAHCTAKESAGIADSGGGICTDAGPALEANEEALLNCETFEVMGLGSSGPGLIFGAYSGHSIEFKTFSLTPTDNMTLFCDGWFCLRCKRVLDDEVKGQDSPFSLLAALHERLFCDLILKSSDRVEYHLHSAILHLSGFDCSMLLIQPPPTPPSADCEQTDQNQTSIRVQASPRSASRSFVGFGNLTKSSSSSNYLLPTAYEVLKFSTDLVSNMSSSFNCLTTLAPRERITVENSGNYEWNVGDGDGDVGGGGGVGGGRRDGSNVGATIGGIDGLKVPRINHISSSDSNIKTSITKEIFTFSNSMPFGRTSRLRARPSSYRPPHCSSPIPSSMDTPPNSPLTPVTVLANLPSSILAAILHWIYAECLPLGLNEEICEQLIEFGGTMPSLSKMIEPCERYLKNLKLEKFVINIVMDVHASFNRIIQSINPTFISRSAMSLCQVFKTILREFAVGYAKILQFCNIFVKDVSNLSRVQRHEIMKYVRTRLPIFMSQIHQMLKNVQNILCSLTQEEKSELIVYLVPEIKNSLDNLTKIVDQIKNSLEELQKDTKPSTRIDRNSEHHRHRRRRSRSRSRNNQSDKAAAHFFTENPIQCGTFGGTDNFDMPLSPSRFMNSETDLKFVLYMFEVRKMRDIYGRISSALEIIQQKRLIFEDMPLIDKQRTVQRNLEELIQELPSLILQLEKTCDILEEEVGWKKFKFCLKFATRQINGVLLELLDHKTVLKDAVVNICLIVDRNEFVESITNLGLLDSTISAETFPLQQKTENEATHSYENVKLNLVGNLCEPKAAWNSCLSKSALRLLHSGQLSDVEFLVISSTLSDFQQSGMAGAGDNLNAIDEQVHIFRAHRIIISVRCEWFKKALVSGMQESISRQIKIYDTSPVIFRRLLLYLYGAPIDKTVGAEQICELLLLADRYSLDELKDICEVTLIGQIDEDSVICLLGFGDRFNATNLKANCLAYLSQRVHLTNSVIFDELTLPLRNEVLDLVQWCGRVPEPWPSERHKSSNRQSSNQPKPAKQLKSKKSSPSYM